MVHQITLNKAARKWDDGLPLGNGRLGAMVMGKVDEETIFINEETMWYGPLRNRTNPDGHRYLDEIRELFINGESAKGQFLAKMALTSTPKYMNPYQPVGDLRLCFLDHKHKVDNYKRSLDLDQALASVSYDMKGIHFERQHIVSQKDAVLAIRIYCDPGHRFTMSANISRKPFEQYSGKIDKQTVAAWGQNGPEGIQYYSAVKMDAREGAIQTIGDFVYVENTNEVFLYLTAATDFTGPTDVKKICLDRLERACRKGYKAILADHIMTYQSYYKRMSFTLNQPNETDKHFSNLPATDAMLDKLRESGAYQDELTMLLFHYARYLLIASSLNCELPANLQGLWNGEYTPPWECKFTININTEMNYWFANGCQLPECNEPLFKLIEKLVENGRRTAKNLYGCRGFCAHHNTNGWGNTDIEGIFDASPIWPMGGAWLSFHLYEHFLHTQDYTFLKDRALPIIEEAILFFEDYLFEDNQGQLKLGPTISPENTYFSENNEKIAVCLNPSSDIQILRQMLIWYLDGCKKLADNQSQALSGSRVDSAKKMLAALPAIQISSDGRIMEWEQEYKEAEPGHRHLSHLIGLHPGALISEEQADLFSAAAESLSVRMAHGSGHTGWSRAWVTCFMARLKQGNEAGDSLIALLKDSIQSNMLDVHPPFQIDGNFGAAEAIKEMLLQSHRDCIEFLPALPKSWRQGHMKGLVARGNILVDLFWSEGKLDSAAMTSQKTQTVTVQYQDKKLSILLSAKSPKNITFNSKQLD